MKINFADDKFERCLIKRKDGIYYESVYSKAFKIKIKTLNNNIYLINKQNVVFCTYNKMSGIIHTGGKIPPESEDINWKDICDIINFKHMIQELKK